jgi:hypothetical protein
MITFKINKLPYQFPTCWDDVTYRQSVALLDSVTLTDHIHIFTGIPKETLESAELVNLEKISLALSFLSFAPTWDRTNMVGRYIMPLDVTIQSLGQFESLRKLVLKIPPKPVEEPKVFTDLCLTACAIYCQKLRDGIFDSEKVHEVKEELQDFSCSEVMGTGAFFLLKPLNLSQPIMSRFRKFIQHLKNTRVGLLICRKISNFLQRSFGPHAK